MLFVLVFPGVSPPSRTRQPDLTRPMLRILFSQKMKMMRLSGVARQLANHARRNSTIEAAAGGKKPLLRQIVDERTADVVFASVVVVGLSSAVYVTYRITADVVRTKTLLETELKHVEKDARVEAVAATHAAMAEYKVAVASSGMKTGIPYHTIPYQPNRRAPDRRPRPQDEGAAGAGTETPQAWGQLQLHPHQGGQAAVIRQQQPVCARGSAAGRLRVSWRRSLGATGCSRACRRWRGRGCGHTSRHTAATRFWLWTEPPLVLYSYHRPTFK